MLEQILDANAQNNENEILITMNGVLDEKLFMKLNKIIIKMACNFVKTNPYLSYNDLQQDAWLRIFEVINLNITRNRELPIAYLVVTARTYMLSICQRQSKYQTLIDTKNTEFFNDYENQLHGSYTYRKHKIEYEIQDMADMDIYKAIDLQITLEQLIDLFNENDRLELLAKQMLILKYVKEFYGESSKIHQDYMNVYNTLNDIAKCKLDNMEKFTNKDAYNIIGIRNTDNITTNIKYLIKTILQAMI